MHNVAFFSEEALPQRSDEWKAWRETVNSASDACIVMNEPRGDGPQTWRDLREWVWEEPSERLQEILMHGTFNEAEALRAWNVVHAAVTDEITEFIPYSAELTDECLMLGASFDGVSRKAGRAPYWVEIKCPAYGTKSEIWKAAEKGNILPSIYWQMAHQFLVLNHPLSVGYLFVFIDDEHFEIVRVDEDTFGDDLQQLQVEWSDYMAGRTQKGEMRGDEPFKQAELQLVLAREQKKHWAEKETEAKNAMLRRASLVWEGEADKYFGELITIRKQVRRSVDTSSLEARGIEVPKKETTNWVFTKAREKK